MSSEKPTSRRDFFRGRSAAESLRARVDSIAKDLPDGQGQGGAAGGLSASSAAQLQASRRAMACEFAVTYHATDGPAASDAVLAALDLIDQLETQLTIYRDTSEILEINKSAFAQPVTVEPRLFSLLELCAWLHAETSGAFDITSGPLSRLWGFLRREGRVPPVEDVSATLEHVGADKVILDGEQKTIHFINPQLEINLNAVGKGYALDRVEQLLVERGVDDFLCHGGRSSVLARGRDRRDAAGWRIAVPHPHIADGSLGEITLYDEALGTSGAGTQFFEAPDGRRYGHLFDPRTGLPADGVYTATVVAPSAAEADALSTAFYIMGPAGASEYCAAHSSIGAVLVCPREGSAGEIDVHTFNLPPNRWRPL